MIPRRSISIIRRVMLTLLVAQVLAIASSFLLILVMVDQPRGDLYRALALFGSASMVATLGAGFLVAQRLIRRMSSIADKAGQIAGGDFEQRIPRSDTAELAPLADALNAIATLLCDRSANVRRLESLRSDFAANVSHELRTPITNIKGYVETLLEFGLDDSDEAHRYLGVIRANSSRLAAIVEDIMALSKLESAFDECPEESSPILITDMFVDVGRMFETEAAAREINVVIESCSALSVRGHRQLLEQAISNLLSNAIRYSHPGADVILRARAEPGSVSIEVADAGPGIEIEHIPRLFERFYRVDKARSRAVGGTGLGLAIVKHIAIKHGGNVEALSEPGKGSVFRIILPATDSRYDG